MSLLRAYPLWWVGLVGLSLFTGGLWNLAIGGCVAALIIWIRERWAEVSPVQMMWTVTGTWAFFAAAALAGRLN